LGQLAKANKQGVASLLNSMGLHPARCARYTLWGGCGDVNCKLNHDDSPLDQNHAAVAKTFLVDGAKKWQVQSHHNCECARTMTCFNQIPPLVMDPRRKHSIRNDRMNKVNAVTQSIKPLPTKSKKRSSHQMTDTQKGKIRHTKE